MAAWYLNSLVALLLLGTQRFLYKVAAERGAGSSLTTAVFMATVALLSGIAYLGSGEPSTGSLTVLLLLALLNSSSFACATIAQIEALKRLPAGIAYPLTRLSLVLVILFSLIYFHETLQPWQWLGVALGLGVVALLGGEVKRDRTLSHRSGSGLWFILAAVFCGAISSVSCKLAAMHADTAGFMTLTYSMGTVFSVLINRHWKTTAPGGRRKEALIIGLVMGVLNFFGFYALLKAMATGPLSAIVLLTGMHFVIAIILSVLIYRERLTPRRAAAVLLTLLAVFLMKQ
ncbi:DMT family transporter [Pelobacter seleniigenes]|uniref:DMT family transporter n=1 Tax=Pelobacter seleniigenes TaxID=407188 RepID=UPI0004A76E89|nr:EamA family transporter [Pelobacter seleniigenes]